MTRRLDKPVRTAHEAVDRHMWVMRQTLHCVSKTGFLRKSGSSGSLSVANIDRAGEPFSRLPRSDGDVYLEMVQRFEPYQAHRGWRVRVTEYIYSLYGQHPHDLGSRPLLAWHWHPTSEPEPHLHIGADTAATKSLHKLHVPTRRVTFEAVVEFAIEELGVAPAHAEWRADLDDAMRRVEKHLSWR